MSAEQPTKKVYLVREAFQYAYGDQPPAIKLPAVWASPTLEEAQACRDRLARTCRHVNPFWDLRRSLKELSSLPPRKLRERIESLGLAPPRDEAWGSWWDNTVTAASEHQLAELWQALDKVRLYKIEATDVLAEREGEPPPEPPPLPRRKAYVVQRLGWQYNDNWYDVESDEPVKAFTDPQLADIYRFESEEAFRKERGNPFRVAGLLENSTSLTEAELLASLTELGVELPPLVNHEGSTFRDFRDDAWWTRLWKTRPATQIHHVWDLFDRVRCYEVVEIDLDR